MWFANAGRFCFSQSADVDSYDLHTNIHQLGSILRLLLIKVGLHLNSWFLLEEGDLLACSPFSKGRLLLSENLYSLALLVTYLSNVQFKLDL